MLKKFFAFGLLAAGTIASTAMGASANEVQTGVQTANTYNQAVGGTAISQTNQHMNQDAFGYGSYFYPDDTVQTGVQSATTVNEAYHGLGVVQTDQHLNQSDFDGFYYYPDSTVQTGVQEAGTLNEAYGGVAVSDTNQYLDQFVGY
jgi:hypothetical protein